MKRGRRSKEEEDVMIATTYRHEKSEKRASQLHRHTQTNTHTHVRKESHFTKRITISKFIQQRLSSLYRVLVHLVEH